MYYLLFSIVWVLTVVVPVGAQQEMRSATKGSSTPLPITGSAIDADHNALDVKCLAGCSGGGAGDASLAEQQTQTGILTTIDADTGNIATSTSNTALGIGATTDAAATAGGEGTVSAKLRNATALIDTGNTTLSTINAKLPSAGALADDTSNPTTTGVAAYNMCFDGSTWDRCVKADAGAGNVTSATQRVVLANNSIPCTSFVAVSQADDATVITGTASQYIYICSIVLVGAASEVINIIEGTGTVCATGTTVIAGSSTQANGMSFAANGGFSAVSSLPFMRTSTLADNLCITQSGTSRVSGWISYTKAP